MSNLNLPTMTPRVLRRMVNHGVKRKIAYATEIERDAATASNDPAVYVFHHGHHIATLTDFEVSIRNAGWASATTTLRLHKILSDNCIPFGVRLTHSENRVFPFADRTKDAEWPNFSDCVFKMVAGVWVLTHFNGTETAPQFRDEAVNA